MDKIRILFLAANPMDTNRLDLEEEAHEIEEKLEAAQYRDSFEFISKWAVRPEDLQHNLLKYRPHIVNFSGHGSSTSDIILRDCNGKAISVRKSAFIELFRTLKDNVRIVVLNACYSDEQAEGITEVIECAVGTKRSIKDKAAISFAAAFYEGLAFGRSVKEAFFLGLNRLELEGHKKESNPMLFCANGVDPSKIYLTGEVTVKKISNKTIKLLIADDHAILRHGMCSLCEQETDIEVIGQAGDGYSVVKLAKELLPDVIIMDIGMPDMNGIDATRIITSENPDIKVIGLSMHSSDKYVKEMFKAGATGYIIKDCVFQELVDAIKAVVDGKTYISPFIGDMIIKGYTSKTYEEKSIFSVLSQREKEVLKLLAEGKTTKQIGLYLHISPKTVEAHRLRIMAKLDIDNVAELTKVAIQEGLTDPEP